MTTKASFGQAKQLLTLLDGASSEEIQNLLGAGHLIKLMLTADLTEVDLDEFRQVLAGPVVSPEYVRSNPYYHLVHDIFGYPEDIKIWEEENLLWVIWLGQGNHLSEFLAVLDDPARKIMRMLYGFVGEPHTHDEVASAMNLLPSEVRWNAREALSVLRERMWLMKAKPGFPPGTTFIDELGLSERAYNCLKRRQLVTLEDLTMQPASALRSITNFGQKCLDEVIAALEERGLALDDD